MTKQIDDKADSSTVTAASKPKARQTKPLTPLEAATAQIQKSTKADGKGDFIDKQRQARLAQHKATKS